MSSAVFGARQRPVRNELWPLFLLFLPLLVMTWTLDSARWVDGLPPLTWQAAAAVIAGYAIVRRAERPRSAHLLAIAISVAVATAVAVFSLAGSRLLGMGLFLLVVTWLTAYATVWRAYRSHSSLTILLPGLLVTSVALAFLPPSLYSRLPYFLLAAAPAVGLFRYRVMVGLSNHAAPAGPAFTAFALVLVVVVAAWLFPVAQNPIRPGALDAPQESLSGGWAKLTRAFFDSVPNRREIPTIRLGGSLPFTAPVALNEDPMLLVASDRPRKWRLTTFETYTSEGWTASGYESRPGGVRLEPQTGAPPLTHRAETRISVRTQGIMSEIATAGIPVGSTIDNVVRVSGQPSFDVALEGEQVDFLPPSVAAVRETLVQGRGASIGQTLAGAGLSTIAEDDRGLILQRLEEDVAPRVALMFQQRLIPPRSYESLGDISTASAADLTAAGSDYPLSITDRYLQLPADFPARVRGKAGELAEGHDNPYDVAISIQAFLRTIPYSTEVEAPPEGADAVEWFIFENAVGFCTYYASAMITMLRSLGIPARLAVGFAPGDFDRDRGLWVVRARHYHAWPEVYFPDLGWVEFEPTNSAVQQSLSLLDTPSSSLPITSATGGGITSDCPLGTEGCEEDAADDEGTPDIGSAAEADVSAGGRIWGLALVLIAGLATLIAATAVLMWRWRMVVAGSAAERAFLLMRWLARAVRDRRRASETPVELSDRLAARIPRYRDALRGVAFAYTASRYGGGRTPTGDEERKLRSAAATIRRAAFIVPLTELARPFRRGRAAGR